MFTIGELRAICHSDDTEQQAQQVARNPRFLTETPLHADLRFFASGEDQMRRRRQQEAAREGQRASLNTAKATSSTRRPQTYRNSDKILQLHCKWSR